MEISGYEFEKRKKALDVLLGLFDRLDDLAGATVLIGGVALIAVTSSDAREICLISASGPGPASAAGIVIESIGMPRSWLLRVVHRCTICPHTPGFAGAFYITSKCRANFHRSWPCKQKRSNRPLRRLTETLTRL